jgi:apolipoprotein N-acyltransferase
MKLSFWQRVLIAIIGGLFPALAWTDYGLGMVLFVAFIPVLLLEDFFYQNKEKYRPYRLFNAAFLFFFAWNLATTWWNFNASWVGPVGSVLINSVFMTIVFYSFHKMRRRFGDKIGYFCLVLFWIGFEYLHSNWDLNWPWQTIGFGFANNISLVQWYEYTGALGGSLWVLLINIFLYRLFGLFKLGWFHRIQKPQIIALSLLAILIFLPIAISIFLYYNHTENGKDYDIVIVQPNVDPYNEKYGGMSSKKQLERLLELADSVADQNVDFFVGPETALANGIWEDKLETDKSIHRVAEFLKKYPKAEFVLGASTFKSFEPGEKISHTARRFSGTNDYYDAYNTALFVDSGKNVQTYHKSMLVIGVEMIPYSSVLGMLSELSVDMGGTTGSLGTQEEREVFVSRKDSVKIAPVVCYESCFGEYVTGYIKNGAGLIFIITNDGWWGNTPGYRQHLSFARIRAVETRRSIARSANTGVSCFINQRGDVIKPTEYWTQDVIRERITENKKITFYSYAGDFLGRISAFFSVLMVVYYFVGWLMKKTANKKNE